MSINDTVLSSEVSSVEYLSPMDSPSFPSRQSNLLISLRSDSLLEAANKIASYARLGLVDSLDSLPHPSQYDDLVKVIEERFAMVGIEPPKLPRFEELTSAFNDLAPTHEQGIKLITPAYLYLRARIIAEYFDLEESLVDSTTGKELTGGSIPDLKLERVSREAARKVDPGLTDFGFTHENGDWCDTLDAMISSSGVLFPTEGGVMNSLYWLPVAVASPYAAKSPSIRAVTKVLIAELHAAPPAYPLAVFLAVTTGVIAGNVSDSHLALDDGTLNGRIFYTA